MAWGYVRWKHAGLHGHPEQVVKESLAHRQERFLSLMQKAVFENPRSPYHSLFSWAGCTHADLAEMVRREGMEASLRKLLQAGVYLTHDEFKGKTAVERGSNRRMVDTGDLANPSVEGLLGTSSSGSRSRGTTTMRSIAYQKYREAQHRVLVKDFELEKRQVVFLGPILPGDGGLRHVFSNGMRGTPVAVWFSQGAGLALYRWMTSALLTEFQLLGVPVTRPRYLPPNDYSPVARWIAQRKREGVPVAVFGGVSQGVRVAVAARELGLDIAGTRFRLGGEALTDAKVDVIRAADCDASARYTISELGPVGSGCPEMVGNCVHICRDSVAVISRRRKAPLTEVEVDSLLFTSLLPEAATVVVNVEMDDAGEIGPARCGCSLQRMGFDTQIDKLYSYGKLTGHGTTLIGSEMLELLERRLPSRFGAAPGDFQLVEREGKGQTDIELRVSPRVRGASEALVKQYFLEELRRLWTGSLTARMWQHSEAIQVSIGEPYVTAGRKVHVLHLLGNRKGERQGASE
jgi:hypothetical protein